MGTTTTPTTTSTSTTLGPKGICVLHGDPHILTFDKLPIVRSTTFQDAGTWWIVYSPRISIRGTYDRDSGLRGLMRSLSVGGPFLQGHTLSFGREASPSGEEEVTWDGVPVLDGPSLEVSLGSGLARIRKQNDPVRAWERLSGVRVTSLLESLMWTTQRSYDITLPLGVEMTVNIGNYHGTKFIDVILTMHPEPEGQSGHCGNFDGNPNDDTSGMMRSMRSQGRLLTMAEATTTEEPAEEEEAACTDEALANATDLCTSLCGGDQAVQLAASFTKDCVYDVCRLGPQFAIPDCLVAWQTQTALAPAAIAPAISNTTSLLGPGCCKPWDIVLENTPDLTKAECAIQCLSNANCDAFAISGCSGSSDETCGGQCHLYVMKPEEEAYTGACFEGAL